MKKPRISKPVHYRAHAIGSAPSTCAAAIVLGVSDLFEVGGTVDLVIFGYGSVVFEMNVPYNEDMVEGTWHYADHDDALGYSIDPPDDGVPVV